ncbi:GGDEF domain-containing protein [Arcobacter sp. 15-2]|uniref:EAL domain-containing protein n=1 Tax=Arcobacter sp. 15-2 TaxID=3374109 RepID=UPI00399CBCB6
MLDKKWKKIVSKLDFAFQPIVNVKSGNLFAVEALLRNFHEAGNFHSIFNLFDDAFHDGILYQLDLELRYIALEKFSRLNIKNIQLFYNLDHRLLYMPDFSHGNTSLILENLNLDKKSICFELSERGTLQDPSSITTMVNRYKQEGYDIAIDDFGTGIAGLQLLYYAESNFIKIDRFFIQNIQSDAKKRLFCSSIINMAHIMGMRVIAEGIESKEEYYTCKDLGADLLQGYFIQKPKIELEKIKSKYEEISDLYKNDKRYFSTNLLDKQKIEIIKPILINTSLHDLFIYFKENSENSFVPIVDRINNLCGVIYEKDIKKISYSQFGIALAKNDNDHTKIKKFIKNVVSAEITWGVDKILEIYNMNKHNTSGIYITKNNKYFGFLSVNDLLDISYNRNLEMAEDKNPLTKLPGNKKIEEYLLNNFESKSFFYIVYFDFNDFKPFNDYYGFRQGDRVILLFSTILKSYAQANNFLAHIGGDDFFVGFTQSKYEYVYKTIHEIQTEFKLKVKELYSKVDQENGYISAKDRFGIERKFNILGVSSAIIEINPSMDKNNLDLMLGEIKKESKKKTVPYGIAIL